MILPGRGGGWAEQVPGTGPGSQVDERQRPGRGGGHDGFRYAAWGREQVPGTGHPETEPRTRLRHRH